MFSNIDAYDYEHCFAIALGSPQAVPVFDIVYAHGFHYNCFPTEGHGVEQRLNVQYSFLRKAQVPATYLLGECVHGQCPASLFIGLHEYWSLSRVPTLMSFPPFGGRVYRPSCLDPNLLSMADTKCRTENYVPTMRSHPLRATVSGPGCASAMRYIVKTSSQEEQLDALALLHNTIRCSGKVLQLGSGECRFAHALLKWLAVGERRHFEVPPIMHKPFPGSWRKVVPDFTGPADSKLETNTWKVRSYPDYVINTGTDPEACIGRVNFRRVAEWGRSGQMSYHPEACPMIDRPACPVFLPTTRNMRDNASKDAAPQELLEEQPQKIPRITR